MQTARGEYEGNGNFVVSFDWGAVQPDSTVLVSISEAHAEGVSSGGHYASRFMGNASLSVLNVVPLSGRVEVRVHVDWEDSLPFVLDFVVV